MKYNRKELWNFINNKKIPQNINDYNFYIDAIKITDDKDLYYNCPQKIQNNYMFVLFLIEKFQENKEFINEVAQNYLSNTSKNDYTYQELIFIMSDLINEYEEKYYFQYRTVKDMIYKSKKSLIKEYLEETGYPKEYGLGFYIVLENEKSEVITNYFAIKYVKELFYNIANSNLEEIIHMTYKDRFDFVTHGIDNFIIEFISNFDGYLAYYINDNMFLIKDIHQYVKNIAKNWNKYIKENYSKKLEELKSSIQTIISKNNSSLSIEEIYEFIDNKSLLLPIKLSDNSKDNNMILSDKKINLEDYKCLKEALNTAEDIFTCKEEKKKEKKQNKTKILDFKPNSK